MGKMTHGAAFVLGVGLVTGASIAGAQTLNLYSARHYDSDEAIFEAFTAQTGVEVNVLEGNSDQLIERIRREGAASPADVFITVDAARLRRAENAGILAPVESDYLTERLPAEVRHPDNLWFGFSERVRVIYYDTDVYDAPPLTSYEELADPRFAGEICIRSSSNDYNQSMVAALIAEHGIEATEEWARGLVDNMAGKYGGGYVGAFEPFVPVGFVINNATLYIFIPKGGATVGAKPVEPECVELEPSREAETFLDILKSFIR